MKFLIGKIFLVVILFFPLALSAQDETDSTSTYSSKKPYHVVLKDGSSYTGFIVKDDSREILLKTTTIGDIYIRKTDIAKITEADNLGKMKAGNYFGDEIYYTRYLFSANALNMQKGEANAYMPYGLYVHSQFGVTDNIDLGIGTSFWGNPLTVSAKGSFELGSNLTGAIGVVGLTTTYSREYLGFASAFGVITSGTPSKNISIGGGYGLLYIDGVGIATYYATGGAYKRVRPQLSLLVDGVYFPEIETFIAGPGIRYFRKRREGEMFDFGIMLVGSRLFSGNFNPVFGFPIISYIITL
ncbi:MAG: hypothetical protein ACLGGV_06335 [Bacteroidia bacterium]